MRQLGGDKEATNVRQCRQQANKQQLDRAGLRHLNRDRYNAAADKQIAPSMTSSSSHGTSHLKRSERKIDESAKAAAKVVVHNKDDFYATNDTLRSVVAHQTRPPTTTNMDVDDRTTATAFNARMNTM